MSYTAGQSVKFNSMVMPATIISGPHKTHGADRWLIRKADETVSLVKSAELSPIMSRRDAVAKVIYENNMGRVWDTATSYTRAPWLRLADRVLVVLEAADDDSKPAPLANGDRIRILRSGLEFASVTRGDVLTVMSVADTSFKTNAPSRGYVGGQWSFRLDGEGKGWERV